MSSLWNRLTQSLVSAGALNARQPLVAWEASWDEAEALQASGQLWRRAKDAEEEKKDSSQQPDTQQQVAPGPSAEPTQDPNSSGFNG